MKYKSLWALRPFVRPLLAVLCVGLVIMVLTGFLEMRTMWETQKVFEPLFVQLQGGASDADAEQRAAKLGAELGENEGAKLGGKVGAEVGRAVGGRLDPTNGAATGEAVGHKLGNDEGARLGRDVGAKLARDVVAGLRQAPAAPEETSPPGFWKRLAKSLGVEMKAAKAPVLRTREEILAELGRAAVRLFAFFMAAAVASACSYYVGVWISQRLLVSLRQSLFDHLEGLSLSFFERGRTGELISRINNDTLRLQDVLSGHLGRLVVSPVTVVACVAAMVTISGTLTVIAVCAIPAIVLTSSLLGRKVRRYSHLVQAKFADLTAVLSETFQGMRVVKIFGMEAMTSKRFRGENVAVLKNEMRAARMKCVNTIFVGGLTGAAICGAMLMGGREVALEKVTTAQLMTFILLMQTAASRLSYLARINLQLQRAEAAAERTLQLLNEVPDLTECDSPVELGDIDAAISFKNVSFAYDTEPVLRDVSLEVAPGEVVALVGPSGAGKTTVANLVARLYDVSEGSVCIDGTDVRQISFASLKTHMGIVPQETILFSTSVHENIAFGRLTATEEEIIDAAKAANAHGFISALPEGYDTQVGEHGANLSGGQRQRLAIARALLRDPAILILDEATSSLDTESEAAIHRALQTLITGRTTIIIAHRLSTIKNADRIIVLDRGAIIEQGTHDELMALGRAYCRLYETGELAQADKDKPTGKDITDDAVNTDSDTEEGS